MLCTMTSLSYGRVIPKGIERLYEFFFILLNLEASNLVGVYKIENK